jgi:hypothetical protein
MCEAALAHVQWRFEIPSNSVRKSLYLLGSKYQLSEEISLAAVIVLLGISHKGHGQ